MKCCPTLGGGAGNQSGRYFHGKHNSRELWWMPAFWEEVKFIVKWKITVFS